MKVLTTIAAVSIACVGVAVAAPNCDSIISHGLSNIEISQSESAAISLKYFRHCQKNFNLMTDAQLANAEIEVFGYGSGDGSCNRQRHEERLEQWCTTNQSVALNNQSSYQRSQTIFQGAVSAWESCNALSSKGLVVDPRITADQRTIDIGIVYGGNTRSGIILTGIATEGSVCTAVSLDDAREVSFPVEVRNLNIQVRCIRSGPVTVTRNSQDFQVLPRGTISIQS